MLNFNYYQDIDKGALLQASMTSQKKTDASVTTR
jgi:hypothetical protein